MLCGLERLIVGKGVYENLSKLCIETLLSYTVLKMPHRTSRERTTSRNILFKGRSKTGHGFHERDSYVRGLINSQVGGYGSLCEDSLSEGRK